MVSGDVIYLAHGGGPLPLLGDPEHQDLLATLKMMADLLAKPEAILVISAHWEAESAVLTSGSKPPLIYDYHGFPKAAYEIQYPCLGEPQLAKDIQQALIQAGISSQVDEQRGFDHGLFVPLKIMFPEANIPCIQLSLEHSLNPQVHLDIGRALQGLNRDKLLVIGSGFSFHNMSAFFESDPQVSNQKNELFQAWLKDSMSSRTLTALERRQRLSDWEQAPHARFCHPRAEHLLPLHVCYGLAERACENCYPVKVMGKQAMMFHWSL